MCSPMSRWRSPQTTRCRQNADRRRCATPTRFAASQRSIPSGRQGVRRTRQPDRRQLREPTTPTPSVFSIARWRCRPTASVMAACKPSWTSMTPTRPSCRRIPTASANRVSYSYAPGVTLDVTDPSKGVLANAINAYGVQLVTGARIRGALTLYPNGTFTYLNSHSEMRRTVYTFNVQRRYYRDRHDHVYPIGTVGTGARLPIPIATPARCKRSSDPLRRACCSTTLIRTSIQMTARTGLPKRKLGLTRTPECGWLFHRHQAGDLGLSRGGLYLHLPGGELARDSASNTATVT